LPGCGVTRMSIHTKMDSKKVIDKAIDFFAKSNGLKITEQGDCCASFEGMW